MTENDQRQHAADHRSLLKRADVILSAFDAEHTTLSLLALTARTGLPKTSVRRSVEKLVELRWLECHGGRYRIGNKLFEMGMLFDLGMRLRDTAQPLLESLYEQTHETVHLAVLDGPNILYLEKLSGSSPATNLSRVGGRMPAYCTGLGKVLVAHSGAAAWAGLLARQSPARTSATIVQPARMERELVAIHGDGVGFDRQECAVGLTCVAAPIVAVDGSCAAAVSVTGPSSRLNLSRLAYPVQGVALQISRALADCVRSPAGYPPTPARHSSQSAAAAGCPGRVL